MFINVCKMLKRKLTVKRRVISISVLIYVLLLYVTRKKEMYKIEAPVCWKPGFKTIPESEPIENLTKVNACNKAPKSLIRSNRTHLCLNHKNINITCKWIPFIRKKGSGNYIDIEYVGGLKKIKKCVFIHYEFVKILCFENGKIVYTDYRYFIPPTQVSLEQNLNMIIIGIEGLSHWNFRRQLPMTTAQIFSEIYDTIEFEGFSAISFNSFDQWLGLLGGEGCREGFEGCKMVWEFLKSFGYRTAFGEDDPATGALKEISLGFKGVDHFLQVGLNPALEIMDEGGHCFGRIPSYRILFKYAEKFIEANSRRPHFGLFITSTWSKNRKFHLFDFDKTLSDFVMELSNDNTVLILMSDYGTFPGKLDYQYFWEQRLPAFYMILPLSFKGKYLSVYKNLYLNSRRLFTVYDLYKSIYDLPSFQFSNRYLFAAPLNVTGAVSIFRYLEKERSCTDIGLSSNVCPCQDYESLIVSDERLLIPTYFLIFNLNLYSTSNCQFAYPLQIIEAYTTKKTSSSYGMTNYLLTVSTKPYGFLYKAVVRCKYCDNDFSLVFPVKVYTPTGVCVKCEYERACYCPDFP